METTKKHTRIKVPCPEPVMIRIDQITARRLREFNRAVLNERSAGRCVSWLFGQAIDTWGEVSFPVSSPPGRGCGETLRVGFYSIKDRDTIEATAREQGRTLKEYLADAAHFMFPHEESEPLPPMIRSLLESSGQRARLGRLWVDQLDRYQATPSKIVAFPGETAPVPCHATAGGAVNDAVIPFTAPQKESRPCEHAGICECFVPCKQAGGRGHDQNTLTVDLARLTAEQRAALLSLVAEAAPEPERLHR